MTDRKAPPDPNQPPEDLAALYSWANSAKHRDPSDPQEQNRDPSSQREPRTGQGEQERFGNQAASPFAEARRAAESSRTEELARLHEIAAQEAAYRAAEQVRVTQAQAGQNPPSGQQRDPSARPPAQPETQPAETPVQHPLRRLSDFFPPVASTSPGSSRFPLPPGFRRGGAAQYAPMREDANAPAGTGSTPSESREPPETPAWLADRPVAPPQQTLPLPQEPPSDTLQSSRERLTARWFALKGLFNAAPSQPEASPTIPVAARPPVLAVFSLVGGVGKTSLIATLARSLSARGERLLLVDTASFGLLPFFFGARDQRPGQLRTFSPPGASGDAPIQMIAIDPEDLGSEDSAQELLAAEISKYARGLSRVLIDIATASGATTRRILKLSPMVLVPLIPDMNSVVSVSSIDAFFERNMSASGRVQLPNYVLNQFDASLPLHLDVREILREQLGERLLPFVLRRAPAVSEALAEGMTVMDYAPNSTAAEDFNSLAGWIKTQSAPAVSSYRGVRWSER